MVERDGLCRCGCGQQAPIAQRTDKRRGNVKGQPQKYIKWHSAIRKERKPCAAEGCGRSATAQYCRKHADRLRIHGDLVGKRPKGDEEFRFWFRVEKTEGCWTWKAARHPRDGYGAFWNDEKRLVRAHRFSYQLHYGPIPDGLWVLHRCDDPPCVRPDHLFLGTAADNNNDRERKGRGNHPKRTHCPQGHPYDESNSVLRKDGAQSCWVCRKEWRKTTRDRHLVEAIPLQCPRCGSGPGKPCAGRFGVMVSAHRERLQAARGQTKAGTNG